MPRLPYYNFDKINSYNGVYNFVIGARGLGKTWGKVVGAIRIAIRKDEQFIYLRRTEKELRRAKATFFADKAIAFPDYDLRVEGWEAQYAHRSTRGQKPRQWVTMGYFVALSTVQSMKSTAFPKVKTIIFDEFIIEKSGVHHYLQDEHVILNNLYSTVDRGRDEVRVWFLANAVSIMNPYFLNWDITPDAGNEWVIKGPDNFIICHFPDSKDYQRAIYQTRFGKFIEGTEYADYAYGNQFADNHEHLLGDKDYRAKYQYTLETSKGTFSVWRTDDEFYVRQKLPKQQFVFTLMPERMSQDKVLMATNDRPMQFLRAAFSTGRVTFDSPVTRNAFTEIFKR